nr:hypothetical protein [Tanacetum cinerariifolium]
MTNAEKSIGVSMSSSNEVGDFLAQVVTLIQSFLEAASSSSCSALLPVSKLLILLHSRVINFTSLNILKWYDYNHLDEIEVRREDQQLYTFKEDEHYDLNVALRMFSRRIVIQRWVEDLQLGVETYQKKLNLTKPDIFRSNRRNKTAYTAYSDPQGVIYKDQNNKKRLMHTDELHKFSDGMLNDVWTALYDIALGIWMEYLPKRKWIRLDK